MLARSGCCDRGCEAARYDIWNGGIFTVATESRRHGRRGDGQMMQGGMSVQGRVGQAPVPVFTRALSCEAVTKQWK